MLAGARGAGSKARDPRVLRHGERPRGRGGAAATGQRAGDPAVCGPVRRYQIWGLGFTVAQAGGACLESRQLCCTQARKWDPG